MTKVKQENVLVSIIMNCFNGETYLRDAIESILDQTYPHWELIFWDNKSTDRSQAIIKSYNDSRIRYFMASEHTNLGRARSLALSKASGKWIGFLDVDDFWYREKLAIQIKKINFSNKKVGMVYGRCMIFENGMLHSSTEQMRKKVKPSGKLPERNLFRQLFFGNLVPFPSVLYLREALESIGGIPSYEFSPDYYMSLAIASKYNALATSETICAYRIHDGNMSKQYKERGYLDSIDIAQSIAPSGDQALLTSYNRTRLLLFYLLNFKITKAKRVFLKMSPYYATHGILGLIYYKLRYSQKIYLNYFWVKNLNSTGNQ
jgi:glycosyltransferase involved in cell wall biosynthesis